MFAHMLIPDVAEQIRRGIDNTSRQFLIGASLMAPFVGVVWRALSGRRFFITDNGYMGLAPADVEVGDMICLLFGVEVPMVLRGEEKGHKEVIGECYCHGIMEGEGLADYWKSRAAVHSFTLS